MKSLRIAGFGKSEIRFDMFDLAREAAEARRAEKLQHIYHRGQDLAWDGRDVLAELVAKHGGIQVPPEKAAALSKIFAIIMWGELAAWKISAQLADRLVPLEAKMAATSQAHDEARHFYVMHDYLSQLGPVPKKMDPASRALLDLVLNTDNLLRKLMGMQLMVEALALTLFQAVREVNAEPVLSELLRYYEKDEARHVGLGIQHLPSMMKAASAFEHAGAIGFQLRLVFWSMASLKALEPDLRVLGIEARQIMRLGKAKQLHASEMLWSEMGIERPALNRQIGAGIDAINELVFPRKRDDGAGTGWLGRIKLAREVFKAGGLPVEATTLDMPAPAIAVA